MAIDYGSLPLILCPICEAEEFTAITWRFDTGRIVRCSACGHYYLNPPLSDEQLNAIYAAYFTDESDEALLQTAENWFLDPQGPYQHTLDAVERAGGFHKKRVLEVGCGPGRFLDECRRRGAIVTGVDRSPAAVRLAKQHFTLDLVLKTLEEVTHEGGFLSNSFDLIFAFEIIEHVRKPLAFIQSLSALLAPEGWLFVSTPNFHLFTLMGSAAPAVRQWPEHLHFFDLLSLSHCLERGSCRVVSCSTLSPMSYGDRQKQMLSINPMIARFWRLARRVRWLVTWKDKVFAQLVRHQQEADMKGLTGTCLFGVAGKLIPSADSE